MSTTLIDPSTGRYIVVNGALRGASPHQNAVLLALALERGSVPGRPTMGSTWSASALKGAREAEDIALTALAPLVADGIIEAPEVSAVVDRSRGRVDITVAYRAGATRHQFTIFRRVQ